MNFNKKENEHLQDVKVKQRVKQCCDQLNNLNTSDDNTSPINTPRKSIRTKVRPKKCEDYIDTFTPSKQKKKHITSSDEEPHQADSKSLNISCDNNQSQNDVNVTPRKSIRTKLIPNKYEDFVDVLTPSKQNKRQSSDNKAHQTISIGSVKQNVSKTTAHHAKKDSRSDTPSSASMKTRRSQLPNTPSRTPRRTVAKTANFNDSTDSDASDFSDSGSDFVPDDDCGDDSDSDDRESNSYTSESESDEEEDSANESANKSTEVEFSKTSIKKVKPKSDSGHVLTPDNYFLMNSAKKNATSDHTLEKFKSLNLGSTLDEPSHYQSEEHKDKIKELNKSYKHLFTWWYSDLLDGFNLIFYGHGSKRNLLHKFMQKMLNNYPCVVVNGFFPSLTLKSILEGIIVDILECPRVPSDSTEIINTIESELNNSKVDLYLIVHNIDGVMLRNVKSQEMLADLSQIKRCHLIASIDHINSPLLWDHSMLSKFNFRWCDTTTYEPYSIETSYESGMATAGGGTQLASLRSVYRSLTTNAKGIFKIIVQHQLDNQKKTHYQGIPFKVLYSKSREQFFASSDVALRTQLTEFLDHRIVKTKRTVDGSENLILLVENSVLQQFLNDSTE